MNMMIRIRPQAVAHEDVVKKDNSSSNSPVKEILKVPLNAFGSEGTERLALFDRSEIKAGALVGTGSFSEVFEISGFDPKKGKKCSRSSPIAPSRRRKRETLIQEHEKNKKDLCSGKALKSRYVIKQLHQRLLDDPKLFRRAVKDLATEVAIMSSVEHPHIAQLHATAVGGTDALVQNGQHDSYFIVLDRLVQTLEDRIQTWNIEKITMGPSYYLDNATNHGRMALKANYGLQIASALQYLHQRRIIFRDLKPQNIGFKEVYPSNPEKDVLALFDFGLARKLPSPDKANDEGLFRMSMVGTRRYMAPEVVVSKVYNEKADVYSYALVFYELTTQTRPYDGIQREEHKQFICMDGKRPKIYSYFGFPPEFEHMLKLAWAQDVKQRLSMNQICETLEQYLVGTIHEGCVRKNDKTVFTHDESFDSIPSDRTEFTEHTLSTANSLAFTLGDSSTKEDSSETGGVIALGSVIPATSASTAVQNLSNPPRRLSFCKRTMGVARKGLTKLFAKCFDKK